jgi:ATP-dependent helicase Lhr and Lhr-like helicase
MLGEQILSDQEGKLWLGPEGEKRYARANFRALYAVFEAPRLVTVRAGIEDIGSVDASFLMSLLEDGKSAAFTLGGKGWEVVHVDWERGICIVHPVPEGRAPRWFGGAVFLSYELCQSMRGVLLDDATDEGWSERTKRVIATLRAEYGFLQDDLSPLIREGERHHWYTFAGGAANLLLARLLEAQLGEKVTSNNLRVSFNEDAGKSEVAIREAIEALKREGRPNETDALAYAQGTGGGRLSKFDRCLPEIQLLRLMRERLVDLEGARQAVG